MSGLKTREAYATARRSELLAAMALGGISPDRCLPLGMIDQEASLHLGFLALQLADHLDKLEPEFILTHPYEGGIPITTRRRLWLMPPAAFYKGRERMSPRW